MSATPNVRIGTSGWSYDHWRGTFFPEGLPASRRLSYYASVFDTVEVNSTFYGLPSEKTVSSWCEAVPEGFLFAVKASRFVTHFKRLQDAAEGISSFFERVMPLGDRLGPILWQLPPTLERDDARLEAFLQDLPYGRLRHAIEFRNESWLDDAVFALLARYGAAAVHISGEMLRTDLTPTADFVYVRFHGTKKYHGEYDRVALEPWASFLERQLSEGRTCYAYFNNDAEGHAPEDAKRLESMLAAAAEGSGAPT